MLTNRVTNEFANTPRARNHNGIFKSSKQGTIISTDQQPSQHLTSNIRNRSKDDPVTVLNIFVAIVACSKRILFAKLHGSYVRKLSSRSSRNIREPKELRIAYDHLKTFLKHTVSYSMPIAIAIDTRS